MKENDYVIEGNSPYILAKATDGGYIAQGGEWYYEDLTGLVSILRWGIATQTAVKIIVQSSHQKPPPNDLNLETHLKATAVTARVPPVVPRIPMTRLWSRGCMSQSVEVIFFVA